MIGDPLLPTRGPVRPPGVRHPNPAHRTTWKLVACLCGALAGLYVVRWLTHDPVPRCLDLTAAYSYPQLDYRGGVWYLDDRAVGWSPQEDDSCISPNPPT